MMTSTPSTVTAALPDRHAEALSAALAAIDQAAGAQNCSPLAVAKARGLLVAYHARWVGAGLEAFHIRPTVRAPVVNPVTGRASRTFRFAGQCDGVVGWRERRFLLEVRTAGEEIDHPDAPFWQRLAVDDRPILYAMALQREGCPVEGTIYDVLRRPAIQPRLVPKGKDEADPGTLTEILGRGTYFGRPLSAADRAAALEGEARETPALFAIRVAADALKRPARYLRRRVFRHRGDRWEASRTGLWLAAAEVRHAQRTGAHPANPEACARFGRACPFLPVCSGNRPAGGRWYARRERLHPELGPALAPAEDPRVLTPSRIQCFRLCRRKHYFVYEMGIEPADEAPDEALVFGRLVREGVTSWWEHFMVDPPANSAHLRAVKETQP